MSLARPFLTKIPCEDCTTRGCESVAGCTPYSTACELSRLAVETACGIRKLRHISDESRSDLASATADGFADALDDVGARLDDQAFMAACGATVVARWQKRQEVVA